MTRQAIIERLNKGIKVSRGNQPRVSLSLKDWETVQDLVLELSSPNLMKSIEKARSDYRKGHGIPYRFESSR